MLTEIGHIEALFRYPVKSMGGERLEAAELGWHGLEGDRRLAFRKVNDPTGFPWLTAGKLPDLLRFAAELQFLLLEGLELLFHDEEVRLRG